MDDVYFFSEGMLSCNSVSSVRSQDSFEKLIQIFVLINSREAHSGMTSETCYSSTASTAAYND